MIYKKKFNINIFRKKNFFIYNKKIIKYIYNNFLFKIKKINIIYVNFLKIFIINKNYKKKNFSTDILVFNYKEKISDIFINYIIFKKKKNIYNIKLIIHSLLHSQSFIHNNKNNFFIMKKIEYKIFKKIAGLA